MNKSDKRFTENWYWISLAIISRLNACAFVIVKLFCKGNPSLGKTVCVVRWQTRTAICENKTIYDIRYSIKSKQNGSWRWLQSNSGLFKLDCEVMGSLWTVQGVERHFAKLWVMLYLSMIVLHTLLLGSCPSITRCPYQISTVFDSDQHKYSTVSIQNI